MAGCRLQLFGRNIYAQPEPGNSLRNRKTVYGVAMKGARALGSKPGLLQR